LTPNLAHRDFTFIIIDVGELIFSGQTFEVTVYENARLMVQAFACVEIKELYNLILRISVALITKCFLLFLCCLSFFVISDFRDDFLNPYCRMYFVALVALA